MMRKAAATGSRLISNVSGPYLGRVLGRKKPMTVELIKKLKALLTTQKS